ncbi:MAG: LLM class flavin-dependent oxidoreductase [Candidatus Caldarchaeum sp.]|nr:LLM class flavin-dependent oxidoreductase [Candidatus Caldarchaeum sp.]MDW8360448.1 LLM class flavin-dependent oxidoreductase [Candidatus Caldarchaeum sp.]
MTILYTVKLFPAPIKRLEFGISFGALYADTLTCVRYSKEAESRGYSYLFYPDSQMIYRDPFVVIAAVSQNTEKAILGTLATSVATRDPTVLACAAQSAYEVSGGRFVLVLSTGDSSVRRIGLEPVKPDKFENAVKYVKNLLEGRKFNFGTGEFGMRFAGGGVPVYVVATGMKTLRVAGKVGDGAVVMVGPALTSWAIEQVRKGCEEVGCAFEEKPMFWCGFCMLHEDRTVAKSRVKPSVSWYATNFPTLVKNTGVSLPADFWDKVNNFRSSYERYDLVHSDSWDQAAEESSFIPDELVDKMALAGTPEDVVDRLRYLERLGVSRVVIRPPSHSDWYTVFRMFAEHVIPCFC